MKTIHLQIIVLMLITMLFSACTEIEITTILNADGSMERIIEVKSDSEIDKYADLPFPVDSTWDVKYKYDSLDSKKTHYYTFKKIYKNAEEINFDYKSIPNGLSKFNRNVKVERKFRWFYTYLKYEESYKKLAKGNYIPFNQYLTEIEKKVMQIDNPDSISKMLQLDSLSVARFKTGIKEKNDKWFDDNLKEEIILYIEQDLKNCGIRNVSMESLRANRDSIYELADSLLGKNKFEEFYSALNKLFKTNEFDKIIESKKSALTDLQESMEFALGIYGFNYKLQMPGLLMDTNSDNIKGNLLSWQVEPLEAFFVDTSQSAESRIINIWAFVVSAVFLIIVIIILSIKGLKRR